jgi:PAS domain S-box-containing protein
MINRDKQLKRTEEAWVHNEQNATEAKNLLKLVLDTIPVRLFWKDLNSVYLGCNTLFAQDAGYQIPEELIGLDDYSMGWKDQADMYRHDDFEVMNSGKPKLHYEEIQTTPEGKQICIATSKVPIRDGDGMIIGVLGAYEDITLRKWAEEELLKARKLESLGLLAAGIAHDFNNILMVILGNITFAKSLLAPQDKAYQRLATAETASLKARNLTQQFLTFSKGGAPIKSSISAAHLIRNYGHFALSGTKSTCAYTFPDDLWRIDADEGQIGQVITNILINADQSMPDGGTISLACENVTLCEDHGLPLQPGNYVKISVNDQGNGIPEEYLGKIFDPYFTTKPNGRGLGLASAYSIMKKHGGHIEAESKAGSGATVTLFLPALASQGTQPKVEEPVLLQGAGKILIMDDDDLILQIVAATLEELGHEVAQAHDGKAAIALYAGARQSAQPFDAVIMDLTVPGGMGGKEAVQKILEIDPQAKVIVSSGYCNDPVMADYRSYGFCGVIAKPYSPEELGKQIQLVLKTS